MGKRRPEGHGRKGKAVYRKQAKRERKRLNKGKGAPIGDIKNWFK